MNLGTRTNTVPGTQATLILSLLVITRPIAGFWPGKAGGTLEMWGICSLSWGLPWETDDRGIRLHPIPLHRTGQPQNTIQE